MNFSNKNLLIGIGAVVVVVLVIVVFVMKMGKEAKPQYSQTTPPEATSQNPAPEAMETGAKLAAQNASGETGSVVLKEADGKTTVTLNVDGAPQGVEQPAHIHTGSCATLGAVKYPLANVTNGKSQTTLDTTLADLKKLGPLAVNVHKSAKEVSVYVACADLNLETGAVMDKTGDTMTNSPSPASKTQGY